MAEIKKRGDRFDDSSFTTIYKSNFGECSRINNKESQGRHQLECWIGATTFKHSYDRTVGIAFSDTFTNPNDFSDVGGDRKHIYLLFTLKDDSQKRLTLSIISNKMFTRKEGALKGKKSLTIIGLELDDTFARYLADSRIVEFRFLGQEYIWRLNAADVRKLLELSQPPPRPW